MSWFEGVVDDEEPGVDTYFSMVERVHMRPYVGGVITNGGPKYAHRRSESL